MARKEEVYCLGQFPDGCGQKVVERPIRLDLFLVRILKYVASYFPNAVTSKQIERDLGGPAYSVVSKLKYFNLIERAGTRGRWKATWYGLWFLNKEHEVVPQVWVYNDVVVRTQGDPIGIEKIVGYEEISHESVAAESVPHDPTDDTRGGP